MKNRIEQLLLEEINSARADYDNFAEIFNERSQLYGVLIQLMKALGKTDLILDYEDLQSSKQFILNFTPDNELKKLKLELIENTEKEFNE